MGVAHGCGEDCSSIFTGQCKGWLHTLIICLTGGSLAAVHCREGDETRRAWQFACPSSGGESPRPRRLVCGRGSSASDGCDHRRMQNSRALPTAPWQRRWIGGLGLLLGACVVSRGAGLRSWRVRLAPAAAPDPFVPCTDSPLLINLLPCRGLLPGRREIASCPKRPHRPSSSTTLTAASRQTISKRGSGACLEYSGS